MRRRKQLTQTEREAILKRDHYRCCKCNKNLKDLPDERVIDHIIPWSKGGSDKEENLRLLCHKCDCEKRDTIIPEVQQEYIKIRLQQLEEEAEKRKKRFFKHKIYGT